jgi:hypothetical protein
VSITTEVVSLNTVHGEVYSIQQYVTKFVSDMRQVSGFLRILQFPPPDSCVVLKICSMCDYRGKSWHRELWQGYKLTVAQLVIKIYSTANGVSRTALISVFSFIKMSGRRHSPVQCCDFWYKLKFETMSDFWTGGILHFTSPSRILSVLTDGPTPFVKTANHN